MAIVERSAQFDFHEAIEAAGPGFARAFHDLIDAAPGAQRHLVKGLGDVLRDLGGREVPYPRLTAEAGLVAAVGSIKGGRRLVEKALLEEGGNLGNIKDMVRASIAVDSLDDVPAVLRKIHEKFDVIRVKDRFAQPVGGYRDILLNFRTPDGVVGEIQIHLKPMLRAKDGEGHLLYERMRRLTGESPATRDALLALRDRAAQLYNRAWVAALSISAAVGAARGIRAYAAQTAGRFL